MAGEINYDTVFAKMVLEKGLCTDAELKHAIEEAKARAAVSPVHIRNLLVDLGYLTASQADRVRENIKESKQDAHQIPGYKILGKLGAGAMAIVYKGQQISLNRTVAIKVLPKRFSENRDYVERFYKEGQAAAKLNHPNIVQAFDVGEAGGYHYFVMEYVKGKTLYEDIANGNFYSEKEALNIIIQVTKALAHAHANDLIHRDVKPKNIMITAEGLVKLADMGLARETTDIEAAKTEAGKAYGTPYYIAPEQIRGELDLDGRADIYSLGATFYHMVTGRVPFMADEPADIMKKHLKEPLIPPDHINTALSAGISEVIEVMMAKRKENRYKNAQELLADLEALQAGLPPIRARQRFDVSMLEQLQNGEDIESETEYSYDEEIIGKYKIAVIVLGVIAGVSILALLLSLLLF